MKTLFLTLLSISALSSGARAADVTCILNDSSKIVPVTLKNTSSGQATVQIGDQEPEKVVRTVSMNLTAAQLTACDKASYGDPWEEPKCLANQLGTQDRYQIEVASIFHWGAMHPPYSVVSFDTTQVAHATGYFVSKVVPDGTGTAFVEFSDSKGQILGHLMSFGFGVGVILDCK